MRFWWSGIHFQGPRRTLNTLKGIGFFRPNLIDYINITKFRIMIRAGANVLVGDSRAWEQAGGGHL